MNFPIVPSSTAATVGKLSLPLGELQPGFSIPVAFDVANEQQLRTHVCRAAKKLGFKLRVIKHAECFEVARVAQRTDELKGVVEMFKSSAVVYRVNRGAL